MYVNPSRLKKNKALLKVLLNNQRKGAPFIINEKRYHMVNDETVEVTVVDSVTFVVRWQILIALIRNFLLFFRIGTTARNNVLKLSCIFINFCDVYGQHFRNEKR